MRRQQPLQVEPGRNYQFGAPLCALHGGPFWTGSDMGVFVFVLECAFAILDGFLACRTVGAKQV
jgi:hypothetical protein